MSKILVTGSSGFIGRKLISQLASNPNLQVTGLSRNPVHHYEIQGDFSDSSTLALLSRMNFDFIFHLGWEGLPDRSDDWCSLNLKNSYNFLSLMYEVNQTAVFNVMGSCLEYGSKTGPVNDETLPDGEDSFARAKIELHRRLLSTGMKLNWYRPFFVYGEGQPTKSLMPFLSQQLESGIIPKLSSLSNSHDFINVEDVARALSISGLSYSKSRSINIGTGVSTEVSQIVNGFVKQYEIETIENKLFGSIGLRSESEFLRNNCGWAPKYVGIEGILQYFFGDNYAR
jgi:dTDP-6-deoxy-L-talose 4-dehydrogenase (NAD+)